MKKLKRDATDRLDGVIDDVKAKQQNLTWPGILRGSRSIDEYLWKGARDAPMVQRIGAAILALAYISVATYFIALAADGGSWLDGLFGSALVLAGAKILHSATRREH